jgi:hypothetical protein
VTWVVAAGDGAAGAARLGAVVGEPVQATVIAASASGARRRRDMVIPPC